MVDSQPLMPLILLNVSPSLSLTVYFLLTLISVFGDFPGSPVVKTSPSNAGGAGPTPGRGAGISHASQPEKQIIKKRQFNNDFKMAQI